MLNHGSMQKEQVYLSAKEDVEIVNADFERFMKVRGAEEEVDEDDYGEYDYDTEYDSDEEDDYYEEEDDYYAGMED